MEKMMDWKRNIISTAGQTTAVHPYQEEGSVCSGSVSTIRFKTGMKFLRRPLGHAQYLTLSAE
jgi:hypothetical protein